MEKDIGSQNVLTDLIISLLSPVGFSHPNLPPTSSFMPQPQKCDQDSPKDINIIAPLLSLGQTGPYVSGPINSTIVSCLIDTGVSRSSLCPSDFPAVPLSSEVVNAVSISEPTRQPATSPLSVTICLICGYYAFLLSPTTPVNLLGKDLRKLGCAIYCALNGIYRDVLTPQQGEFMAFLLDEPPTSNLTNSTIQGQFGEERVV